MQAVCLHIRQRNTALVRAAVPAAGVPAAAAVEAEEAAVAATASDIRNEMKIYGDDPLEEKHGKY